MLKIALNGFRARIYLSECEVPERQKYKALYMAVTGEAGEILETHPTKTTEDIFAALEGPISMKSKKPSNSCL